MFVLRLRSAIKYTLDQASMDSDLTRDFASLEYSQKVLMVNALKSNLCDVRIREYANLYISVYVRICVCICV